MAERREVCIPIGKRTYTIQTDLGDDAIGRIVGIVNEAGGTIGEDIDQNNLLMLTCLHLAYNLEKISRLLESLDRKLKDLVP